MLASSIILFNVSKTTKAKSRKDSKASKASKTRKVRGHVKQESMEGKKKINVGFHDILCNKFGSFFSNKYHYIAVK